MLLHVRLLAQMIGHFYAAKQREQQQRRNAYTQAIHETGSRLTHDVKNLLQSLQALCSAAQDSPPSQSGELVALMQRQLPQIAQRLNATMDKLRTPDAVDTKST
ncbi:MAG: sensor histidine kinase, partial [Betaproteobacteria bacterium]|nr:sensor histidine kinase [Betaproteobacteria bacterium]